MLQNPGGDGKYHIAVCIPSHESVPYQFANALSNMLGYTIHAIGDQVNITTHWCVGTYVHRARQQLIEEIAETGAHYILWLDSDHSFPKDSLIRLLAHDKPMVGINYASRNIPCRYVAIKQTAMDHGEKAALLPTREDSTGLEQAEAVGMGMLLMKMAIVPTLPVDEPWFNFAWSRERDFHVGEDVWFCKLVREAGWDILVDHDLSKECTHVGQIAYRLNHVWAMEDEGINVDYNVRRVENSGSELGEPERSDSTDP